MDNLGSHLQSINNVFKKEHLIFFILLVLILQFLEYFLNPYNIKMYTVLSIMIAYSFINSDTSVYKIIMSGIISTFGSFIVYKILTSIFKKIDVHIANLITFSVDITLMVLLNCVFPPAISYSVLAFEEIPKTPFIFLTSFLLSSFAIIFFSILLLNIIKFINNHIVKSKTKDSKTKDSNTTDTFYQQLEQNIASL